ncbi:MAG: LysR family transcriptional regulator [Thermodesulfobacteriota bacterium]
MGEPRGKFAIRSKIWLENDRGGVVLGPGRMRMLAAIEEHGSLNAAAKAMSMSFRALWARMESTEKRMGEKLLVRSAGGSHGGGSELTEAGKALVRDFRELEKKAEKAVSELFKASPLYRDVPDGE